MAEAKSREQTE